MSGLGVCCHCGCLHPCDLMGLRQQLVKVRPGGLLKQDHTACGNLGAGQVRFSSSRRRARETEDSSVGLAAGASGREGRDRGRREDKEAQEDVCDPREGSTPQPSPVQQKGSEVSESHQVPLARLILFDRKLVWNQKYWNLQGIKRKTEF